MSETLKYKGYSGSIEFDLEESVLNGAILFIRDLVSYEGENLTLLRENFEAAVDDYLEMCAELGRTPQKPYSGTFNVRMAPELHFELAKLAHSEDKFLNDVVTGACYALIERRNEQIVKHQHEHTLVASKDYAMGGRKLGARSDVAWEMGPAATVAH